MIKGKWVAEKASVQKRHHKSGRGSLFNGGQELQGNYLAELIMRSRTIGEPTRGRRLKKGNKRCHHLHHHHHFLFLLHLPIVNDHCMPDIPAANVVDVWQKVETGKFEMNCDKGSCASLTTQGKEIHEES
ncbi:hypothetical protein MRB53_009617 [Persea americana]|uniref:Uncharacterized protein n=1 Tax=Persea americana TaxID=3435 RepID=A0ACC2LPQ2_PERAE|nr:hypothetical protein MRB53_009617 [Persea americana]